MKTTQGKKLVYIAGDYSAFRSECWFGVAKNKRQARRRIRIILRRNSFGSGKVFDSLDKLKQHMRLNKTRTFFPYRF